MNDLATSKTSSLSVDCIKSNFDGSIKHNTSEYYRQVAKIEYLKLNEG